MKNYTVLVVDDDQAWCQLLAKQIEELGIFQVLEHAHDGGRAIDIIEASRPDIIILDLILPVYDGLYILNYVRQEMNDYSPFIYLLTAVSSGYTNQTLRKILTSIDVDYYSIKPISADAIADNLLTLMGERTYLHKAVPASAETKPKPPARPVVVVDYEKLVDDYLYELGAPLYRISTRCLRLALRFSLEDDTSLNSSMKLYERISQQPDIKANSVGAIERNIRTTIKTIQETANPYFLKCFPGVKKKLTNTEFLQSSVYILRMRCEELLGNKGSLKKNSVLHHER